MDTGIINIPEIAISRNAVQLVLEQFQAQVWNVVDSGHEWT